MAVDTVETIVAVATPPGRGGVGIIRISGPLAYSIAQKLTNKKSIEPRSAQFSSFYSSDRELVDQGVLLYFIHEVKNIIKYSEGYRNFFFNYFYLLDD